jgi:hypothetical protein
MTGLSVLPLSFLLLLLAPETALGDQIVLEDGEFVNWSSEYLASGPRASAEMIREPSGGNPGACIRATTYMNPYYHVWLCMWKETAIWDPSVDGEIIHLSLQIDTRGVVTEAGGQNVKLFLFQDERYYGGPDEPHSTGTGSSTSWHTMSMGPIPSDNFCPQLPYQPTRHPDFTATGGPIRLGFMIGNSSTGNPRSLSHLYDNWRVTIEFAGVTTVEATTWGQIKQHYRSLAP